MASSRSPIRILLVDDSPDVINALEIYFRTDADIVCVGSRSSADNLPAEVRRLQANVVLLDLSMPGKNPLDAVRELAAQTPECRVVIYSGNPEQESIDEAFEAGAWGLVPKHAEITVMVDTIRRVMEGREVSP